MAAGPIAEDLVALAYFQKVSKAVPWLHIILLMIACCQGVSEPISWLQVLLLMVLWHLPAFSM